MKGEEGKKSPFLSGKGWTVSPRVVSVALTATNKEQAILEKVWLFILVFLV
jgi:hypothetical protein